MIGPVQSRMIKETKIIIIILGATILTLGALIQIIYGG